MLKVFFLFALFVIKGAYKNGAVVLCFVIGAYADAYVAAVNGRRSYDLKRIDDKNGVTEPLEPKLSKNRGISKDFRSRSVENGHGDMKIKLILINDRPTWTVYHYVLRSNTSGPGAMEFF
jgi:hypothetical protein